MDLICLRTGSDIYIANWLWVLLLIILTIKMRQQSPTSKFIPQMTTTRLVGSPPASVRDQRTDSINSRVTKVTTYRHPKTTITTTYRPVVETRTVRLCTDKKC